jgi:hypothetical protein
LLTPSQHSKTLKDRNQISCSMKIRRSFVLLVAVCIISLASFDIDRSALFVQKYLRIYDTIFVGSAIVNRPKNWVVSYSKEKSSKRGFIYGIFPAINADEAVDEVIYVFEKVSEPNKKVIFSELGPSMVRKANDVMVMLEKEPSHNPYTRVQVFGFDAILKKNNRNSEKQYTINIPDLSVFIVTECLEDLPEFKITGQKNLH